MVLHARWPAVRSGAGTCGAGALGLTLTVLGSSGSYPGPGLACSGYLVSCDGTHVWIDCGPGTMANLQQHVALNDVSAIVATHAHADHWIELTVAHVAFEHYL